jgi:hypothetical protein
MRYFIFTCIVIILISCSTKENKSSKLLEQSFTKDEIIQLNTLIHYFEYLIDVPNKGTNKSYYDLIEASDSGDLDDINSKINIDTLEQLYQLIPSSTFQKIWSNCDLKYDYQGKKQKIGQICYNSDSNYQNYLDKLGKTNPQLKKYALKCAESGDFAFSWKYFYIRDSLTGNYTIQKKYSKDEQIILAIEVITKIYNVEKSKHLNQIE